MADGIVINKADGDNEKPKPSWPRLTLGNAPHLFPPAEWLTPGSTHLLGVL